MAKYTVITMPGDGIGNQVLPESLRVLKAVGFDAEYIHADIGWDCWCTQGNALPDRTIELLTKHKLGLFGAITSKPNKAAQAELKPELQGKGYVYYSPIVTMRQKFNLDICMRPCVGFTGNPLNYIRKKNGWWLRRAENRYHRVSAGHRGHVRRRRVDEPPENVRAALNSHPRFKAFASVPGPEIAVSCRIITRKAASAS
jgi:isocitrate dehydrogenase (NAD+)